MMTVEEELPVYVCLCHGITENQVRACIEDGARSLCDLQGQLGVATNCGCCATQACDMLAAHCAARAVDVVLPRSHPPLSASAATPSAA